MSTLLDEIKRLDFAERIQLVEDLWDSVATRSPDFPITEAQRAELDHRLTKRASEKTLSVSLDQIAKQLGVSI